MSSSRTCPHASFVILSDLLSFGPHFSGSTAGPFSEQNAAKAPRPAIGATPPTARSGSGTKDGHQKTQQHQRRQDACRLWRSNLCADGTADSITHWSKTKLFPLRRQHTGVQFRLRPRHVPQDEVNRTLKLASRTTPSQPNYAVDTGLPKANPGALANRQRAALNRQKLGQKPREKGASRGDALDMSLFERFRQPESPEPSRATKDARFCAKRCSCASRLW